MNNFILYYFYIFEVNFLNIIYLYNFEDILKNN